MSKILIAICISLALVNIASAKDLRRAPRCKDRSHYFLANDEDCKSFYVCYQGRATKQFCPGELLWDQSLKVCNYPHAVKCEANGNPAQPTVAPVTQASTAPPKVTTAPPQVTEAPTTKVTEAPPKVTDAPPPPPVGEFQCPADDFTYVAHPSDCKQFYLCKGGVFQAVHNCQAGLFFTTKPYQACVRPALSDCKV